MTAKLNTYYKPLVLIIILITTTKMFAQDPFNFPIQEFGRYVTWGTVWGDYNNDGFADLYLSNGLQDYEWEGFLFKNNGDGTFDSIATAGDIVTEKYTSGGSSWGDYNNDGNLDMYIANVVYKKGVFSYDYRPNSLHTNNADNTFQKETTTSVGDIVALQTSSSGAVAWLDYNNDGYLDAATSNATLTGSAQNFLYQNSGSPNYSFSKVSNQFTTTEETKRAGLTFADFDEDGDIDIFVASGTEFKKNVLYTNDGNPNYDFTLVTLLNSGSADGKPVQAASWGDYDGDGDLDLYLVSGGDDAGNPRTNDLFRNDNGTLVHVTSGVGSIITDTDFSYTSAFGDYDNDGDLDLFVGNDGSYSSGKRSRLYKNDGTGNFTLESTILADSSSFARSAAWADIDNDGDLDLMVGREHYNRLFTNKGNLNNWMEVSLVGNGTATNKSAIGSLVKLNATINSNTYTQIRDISSQSGRGSHNDLRTHFGLGNATKVNTVSANWSGAGTTTSMTDLPANKIMVFTQGNLSATADVIKQQNFMYLFGNTKAAVEFTSNTDTDGGTLTVQKTESDPGGTFNNGSATSPNGTTITANTVVNDRYWTITESGLTGNFTSTVYLDANNLPTGITIDDIVILKRNNSGSDWTPLNTSKIGNTVYASGITSFSEFAFGYESIILDVKIFLEGPYNGTDMNITLNSEIPETSPYSEDPRTVSPIPADVVDWVLVELRKDANGTAVKSKSVFLYKNGKLVNDDASVEEVQMDIPKGDYFIVIKHRNHLAIMSANTVSLSGTAALYDFTTGSDKFYGTNGAKQIGN